MTDEVKTQETTGTKIAKKSRKKTFKIVDPIAADLEKKLEKAELEIAQHEDAIGKLQRVAKSLKLALQTLSPEVYNFDTIPAEVEDPTESWKEILLNLFQSNAGTQYTPRDLKAYLETKEFYDRCSSSMLTKWLQDNEKDDSSPVVKFKRGYYGVEG